jgi:hypothetical protein
MKHAVFFGRVFKRYEEGRRKQTVSRIVAASARHPDCWLMKKCFASRLLIWDFRGDRGISIPFVVISIILNRAARWRSLSDANDQ